MKAIGFAVAACLVWVMLCPGRPSYAANPPGLEERLDKWQPGPEHAQVPMESIRFRKMDITGNWWSPHSMGHAVTALTISWPGQGSYSVIVEGGGCLGEIRFERTGKYADGVLTLNRPAQDYLARVYKRLYAVRIAGEEYLLPSVAVAKVQGAILKDGSLALGQDVVPRFLFARRTPKKASIWPKLPSRALILAAVCAGAGLVVFILFTTFSGQSLASTSCSPRVQTGYKRRTWDELTGSPQF